LETLTYPADNIELEVLNYLYDRNGNRIAMDRLNVQPKLPTPVVSATYNEANQMLTFQPEGDTEWQMTYDENGNLTSITNSCGTTTYTWDARNRLVAINGFTADCSPLTAHFKYDALGRRIEKTINGRTIQYLYDGLDIVQEIENGMVKVNYIRTLNIDEPLARIKSDGTIRYYHSDALGSVIALTDETGTVRTQYNYSPFGETEIIGEPSDNPFQYTGRENDGTGLYYYRFRYYSPILKRFISEDPIGLLGGVNFYSYVSNSPINYIDSLGLIWVTVGYDYHGIFNWFRWYLNRWTEQIGKGMDPTFPGSDPNEYIGLQRDIIQEWRHDPNNPCRDKEYPIGTRRRIRQTYIKYINPGPKYVLINDPSAEFYYQWTPWVSNLTYEEFPGTIYENLYYWRKSK